MLHFLKEDFENRRNFILKEYMILRHYTTSSHGLVNIYVVVHSYWTETILN